MERDIIFHRNITKSTAVSIRRVSDFVLFPSYSLALSHSPLPSVSSWAEYIPDSLISPTPIPLELQYGVRGMKENSVATRWPKGVWPLEMGRWSNTIVKPETALNKYKVLFVHSHIDAACGTPPNRAQTAIVSFCLSHSSFFRRCSFCVILSPVCFLFVSSV